jgi:hypothetical protein
MNLFQTKTNVAVNAGRLLPDLILKWSDKKRKEKISLSNDGKTKEHYRLSLQEIEALWNEGS